MIPGTPVQFEAWPSISVLWWERGSWGGRFGRDVLVITG